MNDGRLSVQTEGDRFEIRGPGILLRARTAQPRLADGPAVELRFCERTSGQMELAGFEGRVLTDVSRSDPLELTREVFVAGDGRCVAVRLSVRNTGGDPVRLSSLTPFCLWGDENLQVGGGTMAQWRVLKLSRHKSDVPGVFRPWRVDVDYEDAAFDSSSVTAGMGLQGDLDSKLDTQAIYAEPAMFIKNERRPAEPGLFLCVLGEQEHLSSFYLVPTADHMSLEQFAAICEFDGVRLDPGAQRRTHWIMLFSARNEPEALDRFVQVQSRHLGIGELTTRRLNVFCSWYFYGREFLPEDLDENLEILKRRPMPFDVFIIDNGWMDAFGDWNPNHKWPGGMAEAAEKIRSAGMIPGIWTAPFALMPKSRMAKEHPELIARRADGEPMTFGYVEGDCFVVDTTHPYAEQYFHEYFGKLESWGFSFHKLDFVRAVTIGQPVFHDPHCTRAEAYRRGLELIRRSVGPDSYLQSCGGLMGSANIGVADSIRLGADSLGAWEHYSGHRRGGTLVQIKQSLVRNYMSRLIPGDPDSLMLRRRTEPFRIHQAAKHNFLSDGKFTDEEAFSLVVRQYLVGGCTNVSERLAELPEDRRALLRHIIPAFGPPARILDLERENCPTLALTRIEPNCAALGVWYTLAVCNWDDEPALRTLTLERAELPGGGKYAVFEFHDRKFLGIKSVGDPIELEIPTHGTRVLRIAPWTGKPMVTGTDLHLSGGGCELSQVRFDGDALLGRVVTPWDCPVTVYAAFPDGQQVRVVSTTVEPGANDFHLSP